MLLSLKRMFVLVVMALALIAGLFGWSVRMSAVSPVQHHSTHSTAWYCPPPPKDCQ